MTKAFDKIRSSLRRRGLDALLVTQPENRRYLSGFAAADGSLTESAGALLIPVKGRPALLTDFRYQLQAASEAPDFDVILYRKGVVALLARLLPARSIGRLGFESDALAHATVLKLQKVLGRCGCTLTPLSGLVESERCRKTPGELAKIRRAVQLNEEVFIEVYRRLRPGMTEREAAWLVEQGIRQRGADGPAFETIIASGPNGALPHAVPTDRPMQEGEPVIIDMGLRLNGYCSDMTRTVVLGQPSEFCLELIRLVRKAQLAATSVIRAGVTGRQVDAAARRLIAAAGYGRQFGHGLGHGVGLAVHEAPALNSRNRRKLQSGMVVTVEPGIYLPGWGGIRLENMVVVEESSGLLLNRDCTFLDP